MQLADNPYFDKLQAAARGAAQYQLADLIADPEREQAFCFRQDDLCLDMTRQKLQSADLDLLLAMAEAAGVEAQRDAMLAGEAINNSENRPAIHTKLRRPDRFLSQEWAGLTGFVDAVRAQKHIKHVINLGIGGSDLGPAMVSAGLANFADGPQISYVANVDPQHLRDALARAAPHETLFIVTSKTFTTLETLSNAALARDWLLAGGQDPSAAMAAVTAYPARAADWGIQANRIFDFDEGVGGRYSLWSAAGLPVMIGVGAQNFKALLQGAHEMDQHFATAPLATNLPVLMALVRVWNRNFLQLPAYGIMAYDQHLYRLAAWAQQLEMESNGKGVDRDGLPLKLPASPLIWGEAGTNAQHSFFQYLHQGLECVPIDILLPLTPFLSASSSLDWQASHDLLVANAVAQAEALAMGNMSASEPPSEPPKEPHKQFTGNRQSCLISWAQTNPRSLGRLLAFYEHVTVVCGFIWGINSFDQWGVELGKSMALAASSGAGLESFSPAARHLLAAASRRT